jgi:hypothetical protein
MDCPECGKPVDFRTSPFRPFCSERCKLIDFSHWVDGDYAVPGENVLDAPTSESEETIDASDEN